MPEPLRVLVVDDSAVARRLLVEVLGRDPGLEVVGEASSGDEALRLAGRLRPDVITMDVQPGMDAPETTRRIMEQHPAPIVLVSGGHDPGELVDAVRALSAGALAALRTPRAPADPGFAAEAAELVGTVKRMAEVKVFRRRPAAAPAGGPLPGPPADGARPARRHAAELVAVGASTGGPAALATWLDETTPLPVRLAADGQPLRPGEVLIAPAGTHLGVTGAARVELWPGPPLAGHCPSATHLFASVARALRARAVGVIPTGMGSDGAAGLLHIRRVDGLVLAQDEASCVVPGMPAAAVATGAVDEVVPLGELAARIAAAWAPSC